jgi:hypothetical protein
MAHLIRGGQALFDHDPSDRRSLIKRVLVYHELQLLAAGKKHSP